MSNIEHFKFEVQPELKRLIGEPGDHQGQKQNRLLPIARLFFPFIHFISDLPVNSVFVLLFDRVCWYSELVIYNLHAVCRRNGRYLTILPIEIKTQVLFVCFMVV